MSLGPGWRCGAWAAAGRSRPRRQRKRWIGLLGLLGPLGPLGLLLGIATAATCGGYRPGGGECLKICEVAAQCGFLPSSLGGQPGDDRESLREACIRRCRYTTDAITVDRLASCFSDPTDDPCDLDPCLAAAACVQRSPDVPDAVLGESEVTIRVLDGVYWSAIFDPGVCEDVDSDIQNNYGLGGYCAEVEDDTPGDYLCAGYRDQLALCGAADCERAIGCDPSMCNRPFITAAADCRYYGISTVQLGYRDSSGALQLSPRLLSCEEASAGEIFTNVPYSAIVPVALYRGKLTDRAAVDLNLSLADGVGRDFCWSSSLREPRRITRSGSSTFVVPTPSNLQLLDAVFERNSDFPAGCGCAFDTIACEELAEDCGNTIDDDEDGLIDAEDPGCLPPAAQECNNGIDDDLDGSIDELDRCEPCNGVDDDGDGRVDGSEPECVVCGDGVIGPAEWCDDGNLTPGDGCDATCELE